jgi:flagellar hook-basal body complex protein FliE
MRTLFNPTATAGIQTLPTASAGGGTKPAGAGSFGEALRAALDETDALQRQADRSATDVATGKQVEVHQTMIAMEQADLQLQLVMQVRNKLVAAYEEISRMQV